MPTPHRTPGRRRSTRSGSPRCTSGFSSVSQQFPLSHAHDAQWVLHNPMGLDALRRDGWVVLGEGPAGREAPARPGCGKALPSIFLAREDGVQLWATDPWIPATNNPHRIEDAGLSDRAYPIHADARALLCADGLFDAVVSVDAFAYFGRDDLYLDDLPKYVRSAGSPAMWFRFSCRSCVARFPSFSSPPGRSNAGRGTQPKGGARSGAAQGW